MKKLFSFIKLSLIIFLMIFSFVPKSVLADGFMIKPDPYSDRWDYSGERNQQVFINYEKGIQKMIISVGFDKEDRNTVVWLFPIPARPDRVTVDVVKNLPWFSGEEISRKAKSNLDFTTKFLQMTQIYPIPFLFPFRILDRAENINGRAFNVQVGFNYDTGTGLDVVVYEHLEKEGVTSEIITAKTATGLYDYLNNKGLKIEKDSISILNHYIGKEYSFIASWISIPQNVVSIQRGVFVTFPTKEIYYPLLPTSVYENKTIPVTIRIIGFVSPKVFPDIKNYTKTEYYINSNIGFTDNLTNFYQRQTQYAKYTKIEINAPSKFFTDDLWISNSVPIKTYYSTFFAQHDLISALFLLIISSLITGVMVGWIIFKDLRKNIFKLGTIGLSNCLSIFGLIITTMLVSTKEKAESIKPLLIEIKQKGYIWKRRLAAILLLTYPLFLLFSLFVIPNVILKLAELFMPRYRYEIDQLNLTLVLVFLVYFSFAVLVFSQIAKKVKPEDMSLFKQLELNNYSLWFFQPEDKAKIIFIFFFSISFLLISWLLVELIKFTV